MTDTDSSAPASGGPNFLVRAVARLGLSIHWKLLIAFVGITALMAGLALFGLAALQKADARTKALIHEQERLSVYFEIYGYMGDIIAQALGSVAFEPDAISSGGNSLVENPGSMLVGSIDNLEFDLAQMRRRIGETNEGDRERLTRFGNELRKLRSVAVVIKDRRERQVLQETKDLIDRIVLPEALGIQREAYTLTQSIETRMASTARLTTEEFKAARRQVTAAALIAIGLALLMGYAMSSALIWPVRRIGEVLRKVAAGGFDARVRVPNRDELGGLAENVNSMTAQLADLYEEVEAQKTELQGWNSKLEDKVASQVDEIARIGRLRRFLPAQIADLIVQRDGESDLLGVRRGEITVLFADLRGFTAFSNVMPPAQVIGALNAFHSGAGPVIERHGGTIERFLGDGLMVLFGAPVPMADAAQRAVDTALAMQKAVAAALEDFPAGPDGKALGLGIGIGTGVATLGQVGFEGRQDYSAIGPAPNLAARLCDRADAGQTLISHATAWQISAEMKPAGPFDLKGIGPEVAAFEILG